MPPQQHTEYTCPPGIALDAMVAQYVFMADCYSSFPQDQEDAWWATRRYPFYAVDRTLPNSPQGVYYVKANVWGLWSPSSSETPGHAFKVIEKMATIGAGFTCHSPWRPGDKWVGSFFPHGSTDMESRQLRGDSFAHLVCIAAVDWFEKPAGAGNDKTGQDGEGRAPD